MRRGTHPVIAARGRTILPEHLDAEELLDPAIPASGDPVEGLPLRALLAEVERRAIKRALQACAGNRTKTAEHTGDQPGGSFLTRFASMIFAVRGTFLVELAMPCVWEM